MVMSAMISMMSIAICTAGVMIILGCIGVAKLKSIEEDLKRREEDDL